MRKQKTPFSEFLQLTAGALLVALGVYFFKFPNHFSFGGVTGMAVIVAPYLPVSAADFSFLANLLLLAVGFTFLGKGFGLKTAYASLLNSLLLSALDRLCPLSSPLTDQPILELAFAIALPALGAALFGAVAAGEYASIGEASARMAKGAERVYRPVEENRRIYDTLYREYLRLHDCFGRGENDGMKRLRELKNGGK